MCQYLYRQLKLSTHLPDDHQLLVVFFTKDSNPWLDAGKQLEHHRANPLKEIRPHRPFEDIAQASRRLHSEVLRLRIHFLLRRCKQHINIAGCLELFYISLQSTGIALKILIRSELQGVHKNTSYHRISIL